MTFPPELTDLNPQQYAAVEHRGSPLLVVAGAGTGKTRTLVGRVVSLLDEGVNPNRILLLTFTRRAASSMTARAAAASNNRDANQVWGGTFHSVANRLLRSYGAAASLPASFTVMDTSDTVDLFSAARSEEGFNEKGRRFPQASTIASIYSRMVNTQTKLGPVLEKDFPWCADHADWLKAIFARYTEKKRASHILDFDDLLLFWHALLASPIGEAMRCLFDHILIDEYQDTNLVQAQIVTSMAGPTTQVCAVGDDAQAIYRFRAATVENMWNFASMHPGATVVTLEQNYRSTSPILKVANGVLQQHSKPPVQQCATVLPEASTTQVPNQKTPQHIDKTLWTTRSGGSTPRLLRCTDETDQSMRIADAILDARERGIDLQEQAVLYRAGYHGDALELELVRRDIPYVKYGGLKYLESAHIKDVLSLLRIVENPDDELAWHRVLQMMTGIGPGRSKRLLDELRVTKPHSDGLARFIDGVGRFPGDAQRQVEELRAAFADCIEHASKASNPDAPEGASTQILDRLRPFCELTFPTRYENSAARLADIDQLAATAQGYGSASRFLAELTLDPPERTGDFAGKPHLDDDWLTLSTIHSAKGLEWRSVYLLHAADGNIPSEMALGDDDGLAEELRLLYVALTRAKEELTVSFPLRYHVHRFAKNDRHQYAQLSRFLGPLQTLFEDQTSEYPTLDMQVASLSTVGVSTDVSTMLESLWD